MTDERATLLTCLSKHIFRLILKKKISDPLIDHAFPGSFYLTMEPWYYVSATVYIHLCAAFITLVRLIEILSTPVVASCHTGQRQLNNRPFRFECCHGWVVGSSCREVRGFNGERPLAMVNG
jgi:hypothetical protein